MSKEKIILTVQLAIIGIVFIIRMIPIYKSFKNVLGL